MAAVAGVILLCIFLFIMTSPESKKFQGPCSLRERSDRVSVLTKETESLRKKYPTIDLDTVAGASWTHVQEQQNPERPVVLLLVGQPKSVDISKVADDIANMYNNVYYQRQEGYIVRIPGASSGTSAIKVKKSIDTKIKTGMQGCASVALMTDLDKLPACSAILFHGYCDNDSAPFKDAVFIFTMTLHEDLEDGVDALEAERVIQEQLEKQWSQCPEEFPPDKMMAMHSRVANNIVIL